MEYLLRRCSDETIANKICVWPWTPQLGFALLHRGAALAVIGSAAFPSIPPGGGSLLCSRAPSWLDGSESGGLCIHDCVVFFLRAEFPEQNSIMVPCGLCFMVFPSLCPLSKTMLKLS